MTATECACGRPAQTYLCGTCHRELARDLADVPTLVGELDTTTARLHKLGAESGARGGGDSRDLVHWGGSNAAAALTSMLVGWARCLADATGLTLAPEHVRGVPGPRHARAGTVAVDRVDVVRGQQVRVLRLHDDPGNPVQAPHDSASVAARYLADHLGHLVLHPAAAEAHEAITSVVAHARRAIDRKPVLVGLGACGADVEGEHGGVRACEEYLYVAVHQRAQTVACRACDTVHDVADRRENLLAQAREQLVTGTTALSWVAVLLDKVVADGTLRSWASRGQLLARARDRRAHPLYQFGEVFDLAIDHVAKTRRRAS